MTINLADDKERVTVNESFDCVRDCQHRDGAWNDSVRSSRACGLFGPGMPPVERKPTREALYWPVFGTHLRGYRGRYPDRRLVGADYLGLVIGDVGESSYKYPVEDPADGCPRAQYSTEFIDSLIPTYYRRRTKDGGRVPNPRFDSADWLIQEAILYLETEEERWCAYVAAERDRRWEAAEAKRRK